MTHNPPYVPPNVPPVTQWPVMLAPDCPDCQRPDDVTWYAPAISLDTGAEVNLWQCGACCAVWPIPVTRWPVLDGPDCPYCLTPVTCWAAIDPDNAGDLWTCEHGHEFTLTPDGLIIRAEDAA